TYHNFTSLNDGSHTFTAHVVDVAGNVNSTEERTVTTGVVACGDTVTSDVNLFENLSCTGGGLIAGSDNLVIDCKGYTIDGDGVGSDKGIDINGRNNITVQNCSITDFYIGVEIRGWSNNSVIYNNSVLSSSWYGIRISNGYNQNVTYNNLTNSVHKVGAYNTCEHTITNNYANNNYPVLYYGNTTGVTIDGGNYSSIWFCRVNGSTINNVKVSNDNTTGGIIFWNSNYNNITNSNLSNNRYALDLWDGSIGNRIVNNTIDYNKGSSGIITWVGGDYNVIENNSFNGNPYAIYIGGGNNNDINITGNTIVGSTTKGLFISAATDNNNTIWNNYFNNTINADSSGINYWNITKTSGTNILGRGFIGGNFWSDYSGNDTTGDYLGDSGLPYNISIVNGGDYLPLVNATIDLSPPNVTINTPMNQTYSVSLIDFNVTAVDGIGMGDCWYSLDSGVNNVSMSNLSSEWNATNGSIGDGGYLMNVYCNDSSGNINNSESLSFSVDTTLIENCANLTLANTVYNQNANIENDTLTTDCIIISDENITFNGNGYFIKSEDNFTGVFSNSFNTTVKNCNISMGSDADVGAMGIEMGDNADNSSLINNIIIGEMDYGIKFGYLNNGPDYSLIQDNYINVSSINANDTYLGTPGIYFRGATHNTLINNTAITLSERGIYFYIGSNNNTLINNTGISVASSGIYLYRSCVANTFINNTGISNSTGGIYIQRNTDNNIFIDNLGISNFAAGIILRRASYNNTLTNNTGISNSGPGIVVEYVSERNTLINNTGISNSSYGFQMGYLSYNNTYINNTGISNHSYGVYFTEASNNTIKNMRAEGRLEGSYGIYINSSEGNLFSDCVNVSGNEGDVYVHSEIRSSLNNTFVNCSYKTEGNNETVLANSSLTRKWYYQVSVNDSNGNNMSGVNVSSFNSSGAMQFSVLTNSSGWINKTEVIDYVNVGGVRNYYSNYLINVTNTTLIDSHYYNVTSNENNLLDVLTIGLPPTVSLVYPANTSYSVNVSSLNYTYTRADNCWWNNGSDNSSAVVSGVNWTGLTSVEGSNNWVVWCNDSLGNETSSNVSFFKDTTVAIESSSSEGSSGGGGGGGSGSAVVKKEEVEEKGIEISEEKFDVRIVVDETKTREFKIKNTENKEIEVMIDIEGLEEYINIPKSVVLAPGEERTIKFDIISPERLEIVLGKIKISYGSFMKEVLVSVNPQSKETLFDVSLNLAKNEFSVGEEKLRSEVNLLPVGERGVDVSIKYLIKDFKGEIYYEEGETFYVDKQIVHSKEFNIERLGSGDYVLSVEMTYLGGFATASRQFAVGNELPLKKLEVLLLVAVLGVILLISSIGFWIWRVGKIHKNGLKRKGIKRYKKSKK
ncbi:MAG: hypothetical protein HN374_04840, partial [Cryomorphaceae bacterium]|nr:hypothetical protein [Cryomorphaceae bacterium]